MYPDNRAVPQARRGWIFTPIFIGRGRCLLSIIQEHVYAERIVSYVADWLELNNRPWEGVCACIELGLLLTSLADMFGQHWE